MKKLLTIGIVLALATAMVIPSAALAGTTTVVGTLEVPTVTSVSPSSGVQANTYLGVQINGTYLTGASAVEFSGTGVTASSISVVNAGQITVTVAITAGATADARNVRVTTPAGTSEWLIGAFTVTASSFSVQAPAGFSLGIMTRVTNTAQSATNGVVTTTAGSWQVTATASGETHGGFMWNGTASPTAEFQISKNNTVWINASATLTYTQADTTSLPFYGRQAIDSDDPAGTYSITITFTGSPQ